MKKLFEFLKTNLLVAEWTLIYWLFLWAVFHYLFSFDIFAKAQWWKFFHARLHGFIGFVFCLLVYSAIPIYLASVRIIFHTKKPLFSIPFCAKILEKLKTVFVTPEPESEPEPETTENTNSASEYPDDLPSELRAPFIRMKQRLSITGALSTFNNQPTNTNILQPVQTTTASEPESFPIPTDFDIGDSLPDTSIPQFTDINFDEPNTPETTNEPENTVIQYFKQNNIEYETYKDYVATAKYIVYTHSDPDFWILDAQTWFAAGKQHDSPIPELLELATENNLTPVIYFESANVMDFEGTCKQIQESGVKTITDLTELQ